MPDREKVTKALECCLNENVYLSIKCADCPYKDTDIEEDCIDKLQRDSLALLKEQEAKWIHRDDMDFIDKYNCTHFHGMCTNCGLVHDFIDGHTGQYLYCPQCGRSVKWG